MRIHIKLFVIALVGFGCGEVTTSKSGQPEITSVEPALGPLPGGTPITIKGENFEGTANVLIGGHLATGVTVMNSTTIMATTPEGDQEGEVVDVTVSVDSGFATKTGAFTYNFLPVILKITPTLGKGTGGTMITITGRGFAAGAPKVTIAGGVATNVTVVDDTMLTATTAAVMQGTKPFTPLDVKLENDGGAATIRNAYQVTTKGLIAIERRNQLRVMHIDTTGTGTVTQIATIPTGTGRAIRGCALNPGNGQLYATMMDNNINSLITFNPLTGQISPIGPTVDAGNAQHCVGSITFVGNTLFGFDGGTPRCPASANRLVNINLTTGAVTLVGGVATAGILQHQNIALKDAASVFYVDRSDGSLDSISTTTSVLTTGQPITGNAGAGILIKGFANVGGSLFLTERTNPANVYQINTTTAALTRLVIMPQGDWTGLCETPPTF